MHNKKKPSRKAIIQANGPRYANNLEGTVTIYKKDIEYHIVGRFNGEIYKVRSKKIERAREYAKEWLYLYKV